MKRITGIVAGLGVLTLAAGFAVAEETATPPSGASGTTAPATSTPATPAPESTAPAANTAPATDAAAQPVTPAAVTATPAADQAQVDVLGRIRANAKKVDAKADQKATVALEAASNDVEKSVAVDGDAKIAERLAGEFGTTPDALLAEKNDLKVSWGQLMIAHSLMANSPDAVTARQLVDLKNEGMSWPQIAGGMGFRLGEVVSAAKAEAKVAKGLAKADGKVAVVRMASVKAGAKADAAKADAAKAAAPADAPVKSDAAASGSGEGGTAK